MKTDLFRAAVRPCIAVQILQTGEILVSRHCANERKARYVVAEAAQKDLLRTGSVPIVD